MARILKTDGSVIEVKPENGKYFELHEMYRLLGCNTIDIKTRKDGYALVIDDEGTFKEPCYFNLKGTEFYWSIYFSEEAFEFHQTGLNLFGLKYAQKRELLFIVGDVLLTDPDELR